MSMSMASTAFAFPTYPSLLPNTATTFSVQENMQRPCITCHNNPDGGAGCVDRAIPPHSNACSTGPEPLLTMAPCLNAFGRMFRDAPLPGMVSKQWTVALAMADADCDGFTNGQELQDPLGTWEFGPAPGNAAYVTRPGFTNVNPGTNDADGDRYCWIGRDLNMDGDCTDTDEISAGQDCNDNAASVNSGATELCDDDIDNDCDGRVSLLDDECEDVADRDGDGYCPSGRDLNLDGDCLDEGEDAGTPDCDDSEVTVYPGAPEDCFDTLDNNCDSDIDLADVACDFNDRDGDGFCPVGQDFDNNGSCNDSDVERASVPADCNDQSASVNPVVMEVCRDLVDNDCDQRADLSDTDCAHLVDTDLDGYCPAGRDRNGNGNCAEADELSDTERDCDDANFRRRPGTEDCTESLDNDCDGLADLVDPSCVDYLDGDGDGFCTAGQDLTVGGDGDCMDGDLGETALLSDCDDTNGAVKPGGVETLCTDGLDNDCNGVRDERDPNCREYADQDRDGYCPNGIDNNDDGDCIDADEPAAAQDCDDQSPARSPGLTENCGDRTPSGSAIDNDCNLLANGNDPACMGAQVDMDGDGYCPRGRDTNGDGDCDDDGERTDQSDCNSRDPNVHPGAEEAGYEGCTDSVDNDCDGRVDLSDTGCATYLDQDQDGFCPVGRDLDFDGQCLGSGERDLSSDCDDMLQTVSPRRLEVCADEIDNDCDGKIDAWDSTCPCADVSECVLAASDVCHDAECRNNRCVATLRSECVDAGMPEAGIPDAGIGPDAMVPEDAAVPSDAGDSDASVPKPPKPSGCWLSVPGAGGMSSSWALGFAAAALAWRRRRSPLSKERAQ